MKPVKRNASGSPGSTNNLLALGSAAVLAVYAVGYVRTQPAADRLAAASSERRPAATRIELTPPALGPSSVDAPPKAEGSGPAPVASAVSAVRPSPAVGDVSALPAAVTPKGGSSDSSHSVPEQAIVSADVPPIAVAGSAAGVVSSASAPVASVTVTSTTPASAPAPVSAPVSPPPTVADAAAPATKVVWKDGIFLGRGTSRHGDIEAMVEIKDGRIIGAVISACLTRYSCSWINHLVPQVVARQSADVDYVSGATQSANAFYYAVMQALSQAK